MVVMTPPGQSRRCEGVIRPGRCLCGEREITPHWRRVPVASAHRVSEMCPFIGRGELVT